MAKPSTYNAMRLRNRKNCLELSNRTKGLPEAVRGTVKTKTNKNARRQGTASGFEAGKIVWNGQTEPMVYPKAYAIRREVRFVHNKKAKN